MAAVFSAGSAYNKEPYTEGIFWQVSKDGEVGCASIREKKGNPPKLAYWSKNGFNVYDGTYLIEES